MFETNFFRHFNTCLIVFLTGNLSHANLTFKTGDGEDGHIVIASNITEVESDKAVFIESLQNAYEKVAYTDLNSKFKSGEDVTNWLNAYFDEEVQEVKRGMDQGTVFYVRAFLGVRPVGFASFQVEPTTANSVYVRQMMIHPKYQRKGIGKHLLFSIKNDENLLPETRSIYLITRILNGKAIEFYKRNDFTFSKYMHEGYDLKKYIGLEWHAQSDQVEKK
jgi:ribosomal protein S18 acetylase RimI-like enzyme